MYNDIITYYAKTPVNRWILDDFDIKLLEENRTCWDNLTVYIKIDNYIISNWSFTWDTSIITTACASIFWESIIWKTINEILELDYDYIEKLIWISISQRRKNAAVLWLLTTRNAIHQYLGDFKRDNFEDLIK